MKPNLHQFLHKRPKRSDELFYIGGMKLKHVIGRRDAHRFSEKHVNAMKNLESKLLGALDVDVHGLVFYKIVHLSNDVLSFDHYIFDIRNGHDKDITGNFIHEDDMLPYLSARFLFDELTSRNKKMMAHNMTDPSTEYDKNTINAFVQSHQVSLRSKMDYFDDQILQHASALKTSYVLNKGKIERAMKSKSKSRFARINNLFNENFSNALYTVSSSFAVDGRKNINGEPAQFMLKDNLRLARKYKLEESDIVNAVTDVLADNYDKRSGEFNFSEENLNEGRALTNIILRKNQSAYLDSVNIGERKESDSFRERIGRNKKLNNYFLDSLNKRISGHIRKSMAESINRSYIDAFIADNYVKGLESVPSDSSVLSEIKPLSDALFRAGYKKFDDSFIDNMHFLKRKGTVNRILHESGSRRNIRNNLVRYKVKNDLSIPAGRIDHLTGRLINLGYSFGSYRLDSFIESVKERREASKQEREFTYKETLDKLLKANRLRTSVMVSDKIKDRYVSAIKSFSHVSKTSAEKVFVELAVRNYVSTKSFSEENLYDVLAELEVQRYKMNIDKHVSLLKAAKNMASKKTFQYASVNHGSHQAYNAKVASDLENTLQTDMDNARVEDMISAIKDIKPYAKNQISYRTNISEKLSYHLVEGAAEQVMHMLDEYHKDVIRSRKKNDPSIERNAVREIRDILYDNLKERKVTQSFARQLVSNGIYDTSMSRNRRINNLGKIIALKSNIDQMAPATSKKYRYTSSYKIANEVLDQELDVINNAHSMISSLSYR